MYKLHVKKQMNKIKNYLIIVLLISFFTATMFSGNIPKKQCHVETISIWESKSDHPFQTSQDTLEYSCPVKINDTQEPPAGIIPTNSGFHLFFLQKSSTLNKQPNRTVISNKTNIIIPSTRQIFILNSSFLI